MTTRRDPPDIILIRGKGRDDGNMCIPFGLIDIQLFLEKNGYKAWIIDRHLFPENINETANRVLEHNPRFVGFSAMTSQIADVIKCACALRKKRFKGKLIFGGVHVTALPQDVRDHADFIIRKEGELSLKEILSADGNPSGIIDGQPLLNLDEIPLPDEKLLEGLHPEKHRNFNILTGRGCPFRCSFCLHPDQRETRIRYHSIDYVMELIKRTSRVVPTRRMFIMDDIFTLNKNRVLEFCDKLSRLNLNLEWWCFSHVKYGNAQMYKAMKNAGCSFVSLGIESGNENVLRLNHKNITPQEAIEKVKEILDTGLDVQAQFLLGLLGDNAETMEDTIKLAKELKRLGASVSCGYAQPFPGSEMYDRANEFGRYLTNDIELFYRKSLSYIPKGIAVRKMLELHYRFERETRGRYQKKPFSILGLKHRARHLSFYLWYVRLRHLVQKLLKG